MMRYPWKGNVRELKNVVERMLVMTGKDVIEKKALPAEIRGEHQIYLPEAAKVKTLKDVRDLAEKDFILAKLEENGWNISQTARGEKTNPQADWVKKYRAILWAIQGEKDKALALCQNSEIHALLGMNDEAFRALAKEIRGSLFSPYLYYQDLLHNTFYDKLCGDGRLAALLEREKKLYDEAVKKHGVTPEFE